MPLFSTRGAASAKAFGLTSGGVAPYNIDYLVVGSGGYGVAGGGGAGGYRTASGVEIKGGKVYTITIGAGGNTISGPPSPTTGGDCSIIGTGLSITSAGGGNCGGYAAPGRAGGSGSGAGTDLPGWGGAGNTPPTSPSQGNDGGGGGAYGWGAAGGGGGAGAVGSTGGNNPGGTPGVPGGDGLQSSITGSSIYYAGGGGGSGNYGGGSGPAGSGGAGGGGNAGGSTPAAGNPGTDGLGGGGGASGYGNTSGGGVGGKGVVILRMLSANYSGKTTGSPTVTTDGSYKVVKFTDTGSYTA